MKNLKIESAAPSDLIDSKLVLPNIRKGQARPPSTQQHCSNRSRQMVGKVQQQVNMKMQSTQVINSMVQLGQYIDTLSNN